MHLLLYDSCVNYTGELEMKISNSKKELARIISENGGWTDGEFATQDKDGYVSFSTIKPTISTGRTAWGGESCGGIFATRKLPNWHQTILSREEYFRLYPAPDSDGWIEWGGGEFPALDESGSARRRDGVELSFGPRNAYNWRHDESCPRNRQIVAYRLHKQEQAKPQFCESVMRSSPEPDEQVWTNPPSIEQLAADYRNAKDFAEHKQQEADSAKADADDMLKELEIAGEAIGLLVSPITAKPDPELVVTDWRQLKVGDLVEITTTRDGVNIGEAATIIAIDENNENFPVTVTFPEDKYPLEYSYERPPTTWRFISRP